MAQLQDQKTTISNASKKILLLEDDVDLQEVIIKTFKAKNFSFTVYADPTDAFSRAAQEPEFFSKFDLVITDFRMPKITGMQFIHEFRKIAPNVPIILMTATNKAELAVEAIRSGAYDFVVKPLNFSQLGVSIDRALNLSALQRQNETLKSSLRKEWSLDGGIIGKSAIMRGIFDLAKRVAQSSANVLITGESGTGKEVIARAIHNSSKRSKASFLAINCSAIPEALLESELFGHVKGSFTGATDSKMGLFGEAEGGTIFLDEIGDLNMGLQAKLLRVIQERKIKRVGESTERSINVRVLAATHKNLKEEVHHKRFREDLFFRLNVIQIKLPPLRERKEDILPLAEFFLKKFAAQNNSALSGFSKEAVEYLWKYTWPGNVRELENALERAVILCTGTQVGLHDLQQLEDPSAWVAPQTSLATPTAGSGSNVQPSSNPVNGSHSPQFVISFDENSQPTLEEVSKAYAKFVVEHVGGVKERATRILNIDRKTLYKKIAEASTATH